MIRDSFGTVRNGYQTGSGRRDLGRQSARGPCRRRVIHGPERFAGFPPSPFHVVFVMFCFALLISTILCVTAPLAAAKRDAYKAAALLASAADSSLSHMKRVSLMERAVQYDPSGRAMHALARHYLSRDTVLARRFARQWVQRAMKREPENAAYMKTYAEIFWQSGSRDEFYKQIRRAVALSPNDAGALYLAGRYAAREMMYNLERETLKSGLERKRRFHYGDYGRRMREQAIGYLTRTLEVDPEHRPARILLGQVYLEGHMADLLVELFEGYTERHPEDWDAYFFTGLGYQSRENLDKAFAAYTEGLNLMSRLEQQFIRSVVVLADREALKDGGELPDEETLRRFWTGRDPLFLTPGNERMLEHCRRVAYANLRFSDPDRGVEGWETDRGQVYIRYGHPDARNIYLDRMNYVLLRETWSYPGFSVTFERLGENDWDVLQVSIRGTVRSRYKDLLARVPEYYSDPYWLKRYDAPFEVAQFRGEDGKTRVELYYALSGEHVEHREVSSGIQSVDLMQGLFLFDAGWKEVEKVISPIHRMPWIEGNAVRDGYLFWGERLSVDPGMYHLAVETEDRNRRSLGTFRDSLQISRYGRDRLEISDLLLAQRVVEQDDRPFGRDRFMVLPNPLKRCQRDGSMTFYFEVYNLKRDEFGAARYRITYQTRLLPEKWTEKDVAIPEWTTAVTNSYSETRDWQPHYLTLDMEGSTPGPWAFKVVVEDLQAESQAASSAVFRVMP